MKKSPSSEPSSFRKQEPGPTEAVSFCHRRVISSTTHSPMIPCALSKHTCTPCSRRGVPATLGPREKVSWPPEWECVHGGVGSGITCSKKKIKIKDSTIYHLFFFFCDLCTDSLSAFFKLRKAGPLKQPQEPNIISDSSAHIVHKSKSWFRKIPGTKSLYHLRSEFVYQGHYLTWGRQAEIWKSAFNLLLWSVLLFLQFSF